MGISTGSAAPPEIALRMFRAIVSTSASALLPSSAPSSAQYIVGTPAKTVISSRPISASAAAASNRGISTRVEPTESAEFMLTVWPKEWNSGSVTRQTSNYVGVLSNRRSADSALSTMLEWVSSAPFGCPVVPPV